jgi:CubicO group peptidase (beta-lactamase class C family)
MTIPLASPSAVRPTLRSTAVVLALALSTLLHTEGAARSSEATIGPQAQSSDAIAARVERVLKGLRPKVEAEGAPMRWTIEERMVAYGVNALSFAIVNDNRVIWAGGFGVKEEGGKDRVTATTLFQAASVSKPIAMSAMLRLVDKGRVGLDTNVNSYLTSWKLPENDFTKQAPVTLRRIATHTAGTTVAGFPGYRVDAPRPTLPEVLDGKPPANNEPVRVNQLPGQAFRYSGGGFSILQQVLVDVSGTPFPAFAQQEVFGPLGMKHSTFEQPLPAARGADAAHGYEKRVAVPGGWHVYPEMAAAGLWTTPTDLATWAIAIGDAVAGRPSTLLTRETASQIMGSAVPGKSATERIVLGLMLYGKDDNEFLYHTGQNEGFMSQLKMYPYRKQGVAMGITAGEASWGLVKEIEYALAAEFGWPDPTTSKVTTVTVDPAVLDQLTGTYFVDIASGRQTPRVTREGTRMFFDGWGKSARKELYPQSATAFITADGNRFTFSQDASGRVLLTMGEGPRANKGYKQ